jgi:lysophospholipase L1-like esterase
MTQLTDMTDAVASAHQRKTLRQVRPIRGVRRVRPTRFVHAVVVCAALIAFAACGGGGGGSSQEPNGSATPTPAQLQLVAIGDSIPYNSSDDCPGCKGFVDRYGAAIQSATNRPVQVGNLSEHTNLTLPELVDHLPTLKDQLGTADIIVVAIAHNSNELNADRPCGGGRHGNDDALPDWSKLTPACAKASAEKYRPQFDTLFKEVAATRTGKPTVLRAINRYNDYIGWPEGHLTPAQNRQTIVFLDEWNTMLCRSAEQHGFQCMDIYLAFNGPHGSKAAGKLLAADYTHPSDEGNAKIAEMLTKQGYKPVA